MAKPRSRTADLAVYLVVRAVVCVIQSVPPAVAFWLADGIAWLIYRFVPSRRRVALENLVAAFPELATNPARADRVVRAMYRHFLRAVIEGLLLPRKLHLSNWRAFVDLYPGFAGISPALLSDRAALIVTAHFGNWEMAGFGMGVMGFKTYAIARVLDNLYLDRFVLRLRQGTGQTIIEKKDFDGITAALSSGGKVSTLADQDAGPRGVFVDFFGRPASTHKAIALMAIEFGATIVVTGVPRVSREGRASLPPPAGMEGTYYAVEVEDVIDPQEYAGRTDAVQAITARYTTALERLILRHPEQYFWIHRRWKHQPKAKAKPTDTKAA